MSTGRTATYHEKSGTMAFSLLSRLIRRSVLDLAHLAWRPFADSPIQVEQYPDGDSYVVRAELPGLDPDRDIHVALVGGELRIRAERTADPHAGGRSDFRYGVFYRGIELPQPVSADAVDARYERGILEVRIGLDVGRRPVRDVPVAAVPGRAVTGFAVTGRDQRHEQRSRTAAAGTTLAVQP